VRQLQPPEFLAARRIAPGDRFVGSSRGTMTTFGRRWWIPHEEERA
jgi:hypothetical protein